MGRKNNLEVLNSKPFLRFKKSTTLSNLWIYILSLAKKKEVYAYTLVEQIEKKFGFKPSLLWVYLVLYKLEADGFLQSKEKDKRNYYSLTKKGFSLLKEGKNFLKELYKKL
ncbi:MAG: PadR family transcriptional regulator [Candidatus Micrarchaeota archaeon]|nr:PadR family transcriptional regulator [Candidatus Micrarchaeota archaeon]